MQYNYYMSIIIKRKYVLGQKFPLVVKFYRHKACELNMKDDADDLAEKIALLPIYKMNGLLFDSKGLTYGLFYDGDERDQSLTLQQNGKEIPVKIPSIMPMILLSDFGDGDFMQATIVHETAHYFKNLIEGVNINLRDEEVAVDCESEYLERYMEYTVQQVNKFLAQKYR